MFEGHRFCPRCDERISEQDVYCPRCKQRVMEHGDVPTPKSPIIAALLSAVIIGLGQMYNGQFVKGLRFMIIGVSFAFMILFAIGLLLLPLFWLYNVYDAYSTAAWRTRIYNRYRHA